MPAEAVVADSEVEKVRATCCTHLLSTDHCHGAIASVDLVGTLCWRERCAQMAGVDLRLAPDNQAFAAFAEVFSGYHRGYCSVQTAAEQKVVRAMAIAQMARTLLRRMRFRRRDRQ